jgi:hypothetical protein
METELARKEMELTMTGKDLIILMSEGNPGALTVLMSMLQKDETTGFASLLHLDDMNIRGTQIWVGYKDYCGEDMDKFLKCVMGRDKGMVAKINEAGRRGNHRHLTVTSGASSPGGRKFL